MRAVSAVKRNICLSHKAGIPIVMQVSIFHRGEPWKLTSWDGGASRSVSIFFVQACLIGAVLDFEVK